MRGNIRFVKELNEGTWIVTGYEYDPLSQITKVTDDRKNVTTVLYDDLGRRTSIDNPDTGLVEYAFDAAGNLIAKTTPNLRQGAKAIHYLYDYNRLAKIDYPEMADVSYSYGAPGAPENRAGRIERVETADYTEERSYGDLGETVKTVKSIRSDVPSRAWPVFTTAYVYDYFGRLRRLTYPDGELLTYTYDKGGLLQTGTGVKGNKSYLYLKDLAYDEFGQRVRLQLGNGVETKYSYDPLTRRLASILTVGAAGQVLQNLSYGYDEVGNVLSTTNRPFVTRDDTARSVEQNYLYDDLHRLFWADGTYKIGGDHIDRYHNDFTYDTIGNFKTKDQRHWYEDPLTGTQAGRPHTTYTFGYQYKGAQPHAVTHVGGNTYSYDKNGNLILRVEDQTGKTRQILWNEEKRITQIFDQGKETIFRYDDAGMRIVKRGKYGETVYVDPNFSIREGEVASKHIFAGNTRIATKLVMMENRTGASKNTYIRPPATHGHSDAIPEKSRGNHTGEEKQLDPELQKQVNGQGWQERQRRTVAAHGKGHDKVKTDNGNDTGLPGNSEKGLENALSHGNGNKIGIYKRLDRLGYEVTSDHRIVPKGTDGSEGDGSDPVFSSPTVPEEHQIFYYHGDHLGSSNIITDRFGRNYEHLEYFPYGEAWVEETRSETNLPYKFTGKELDPETGLYYFGARYYDPVVGVWVSVDPKFLEYLPTDKKEKKETLPGLGGVFNPVNNNVYAYAGINPVLFIDPDGNDIAFSVDPEGAGGNGHTSLFYQDKEGSWFKYDQGARGEASSGGNLGFLLGLDAPAGVTITPVEEPSENAITIHTTPEQDESISRRAEISQLEHNLGLEDYNLYSNNCTDAATDVVNKSSAGLEIPNPWYVIKPNSWFKGLQEWANTNINQQQKEIVEEGN